jgi:hypothetical protein
LQFDFNNDTLGARTMRVDLPRLRLAALALALLGLILQDASLAHQHRPSQPGFFNYDHDLGNLAAVGGGPVPEGLDVVPGIVPFTPGPAASPTAHPPAPRRPGHPRAPPLLEPPTSP